MVLTIVAVSFKFVSYTKNVIKICLSISPFNYFCIRSKDKRTLLMASTILNTMQKTIRRVSILLCLLIAILLKADNGFLIPAQQLSSSLINCIVQDRYGLIWIGTEYGLSRFDGYHFTNYLHDDNDTTSLSSNTITSFLIDKKGEFWIGSSMGLMRYDYSKNSFCRIPLKGRRSPTRIYTLLENKEGDILVGTAGYGLYSQKKGKKEFILQRQYMRRDSDEFFTHLYEDRLGYLWKSNHLSDFSYYTHNNVGKVFRHDLHSAWGSPVAFIPQGHSLLVVCMSGIAYYDYRTKRLYDAGYDFGPLSSSLTINTAMRDREGNLYLGTAERGILVAVKGSHKVVPYHGGDSQTFDLSTAFINSLYEDKDRNLWAGCYRKGLYLVNKERPLFHNWNFASQGYRTGSSVSSMTPGGQGDVWCTVQNNGVYHFDATGKITAHPSAPAGARIIYHDRKGRYWIGSNNGLYRYQPETGSSKQCLSFESAGVYSILDDANDHLYISVYSKGLYIYNISTGETTVYNMRQRGPKGYLCNDWIRDMTFDRRGLLWIATSNGVSCFDPRSHSFKPLGWHNILQNKLTNTVCTDADGNVVIGTDKGLYLYDYAQKKVMPFPHSEPLKDKQACAMVKDGYGNLWISTTMGIWRYDRMKKQFYSYIRGNGLTAHEYMLGSDLEAPDGQIGFGTCDGITTFSPQEIMKDRQFVGKPHLVSFIVAGERQDWRKSDFSVPYNKNSFTMEFSQLDYKRSDDIAYRYRINGGKWMSTEEGVNQIPFTQMEPGDYRIEVKASLNGKASEESTLIHINVKSPWYASVWAYSIYLAIIVVIVLFFYRQHERRRRADIEEQKMRFLIDATHDIRSPLTLIMGPLKKLRSRITDSESQRDIETIDHNAQRLLVLVNQILDERKIDKGQVQLHCEETDLVDFAAHCIRLYQYSAQDRNITLRLTDSNGKAFDMHHKPVKVWIDRVMFDKVISNLLSNAFKYTFDGGEITVSIGTNDNMVVLKVTDSGIGFKEPKTDKLFDRFYQSKDTSELHINGTGIGLNLCRNIVTMHGGKIKAYNRTDGKRGACLEVMLLRGNSHLKPEEISVSEKQPVNEEPKSKGSRNFSILIADDDYEIPAYIERELGQWYRFDSAQNGKEALEKVLTGRFDLVVSDVMMPEMDGITLLRNIKGSPRTSDIPVILLTSKSEVGNRLEGLRKGADAFLAKPFDIDELHILIDNLVDNVRRLRGKFSGAQQQEDKVEDVTVKGNNDALMERIMKSINANLADPEFNVEKLADDVGISRAQLHRKMKEITGIPTGDFIRNLRLEQAKKLLKEGSINITQVAYAVGFNNQTYFSTVFKKHFGVSPSAYAQECEKDQNSRE